MMNHCESLLIIPVGLMADIYESTNVKVLEFLAIGSIAA
jgi:hypothetical protein